MRFSSDTRQLFSCSQGDYYIEFLLLQVMMD